MNCSFHGLRCLRRLACLLLATAWALCTVPGDRLSAPAVGRLHPSLMCEASPSHSYALYLPKAYREDRLWPVIFVFSPSGEGAAAAALYEAGAERLGWIVVASNDARNGPKAPIRAAQAALWKEVFDHYKADPKRVYASGFSGGARMSMDLAESHSGAFQGLISMGAFGTDRTVGPKHLSHVLLCGEEDFNQYELAKSWERLRDAKGRWLWFEHYPGGHAWGPANLIEEGMVFLDLTAGLKGLQPRDLAGEATFLQRRLEAARANLNAEDRAHLSRLWQDVATLPGAPAEALQQAQRLAHDPGVQAARQLERTYPERSHRLHSDGRYLSEVQRFLGLAAGKGTEALDARRLLERERSAQEESCLEALQKQSWESALARARGLLAMGDRGKRGGAYAAGALAQLGRKEEALAELKAALARGYRPSRPLMELPLLAPLREEPGFKALQAQPRQTSTPAH